MKLRHRVDVQTESREPKNWWYVGGFAHEGDLERARVGNKRH